MRPDDAKPRTLRALPGPTDRFGPHTGPIRGQRRSRRVAVGVEPTIRPAPARCLRCLPKLRMTELALGANLGARRSRSARTAIHVDTLPSTVLIVKRHTGGRLRTPGRDLPIRRSAQTNAASLRSQTN